MSQGPILLIEDDEALRNMYNLILTKKGFSVDLATDGEEGLNKAKNGGYALILLDLLMPKLDGIGVLRGLKNNPPQNSNGPIVMLSNAQFDDMVKDATELGAAGVLLKADLLPADLVAAVNKYLATSIDSPKK